MNNARNNKTLLSLLSVLSVLLISLTSQAQFAVPVGLYEGMLGNTGIAISDPTAASFYNPSLLSKKKSDSYGLSGNSLSNYLSKSETSQFSSLSLNPSYLSTVLVGDSLVHEIFIINLAPANFKQVSQVTTVDALTNSETNQDITQFLAGYSMAFRRIPLALSYFAQYSQLKTFGFSDVTGLTTSARSTGITRTDYKSLGLGISISGHTSFNTYTFGYHFRSRQFRVYKKSEGTTKTFTHGSPSASDYVITEVESTNSSIETLGSNLTLGHGFKVGSHEFLTDSQLQESADLNYRYTMNQSFGYRLNSTAGHQFMCGINHKLGPDVKYFGQSAYYSAGYSWLTRTLRSGVGAYVYNSKLSQDTFVAGLTFGSEISY